MKYVIVYCPPSGYWDLVPFFKDNLMELPDVLGVVRSRLYSLQPELIREFPERPLTVLLWDCEDRYGIGQQHGFETVMVKNYSDLEHYAKGLMPEEVTVKVEDDRDWTYVQWVNRDEQVNP